MQSGEFAGYIGTVVDITARKEAEIELRKSEEYFRYIVDTSPIMLTMATENGHNEFSSESLVENFGLTKEDFKGLGWLNAFHPDDWETLIETYNQAFQNQTAYIVEVRGLIKNGEYRWFMYTGQPRFDENGGFIGIIGTVTDIQERKEAGKMELRKSQEYFRYIVDTSPVMSWMSAEDGHNEFVSEGLAEYFGLSKEAFKGLGWLDLSILKIGKL